MTSLAMLPADRCPLCGCRVAGMNCGSYRVNKHSLVLTAHPALLFQLPTCRECGFETEAPIRRWRLDLESLIKVNALRVKKGWPAWGRPSNRQPAGAPL